MPKCCGASNISFRTPGGRREIAALPTSNPQSNARAEVAAAAALRRRSLSGPSHTGPLMAGAASWRRSTRGGSPLRASAGRLRGREVRGDAAPNRRRAQHCARRFAPPLPGRIRGRADPSSRGSRAGGRACRTSLRPVRERARMSDDAELDPLRVAFLVTHTFEALGVRYFIGGSLASIFHGLIRTTNDADLVAELASSHVTALVAALEGAFYIDAESIREAIARKASFNLIHLATMFKVDVYVSRGRPFDGSRSARRRRSYRQRRGRAAGQARVVSPRRGGLGATVAGCPRDHQDPGRPSRSHVTEPVG